MTTKHQPPKHKPAPPRRVPRPGDEAQPPWADPGADRDALVEHLQVIRAWMARIATAAETVKQRQRDLEHEVARQTAAVEELRSGMRLLLRHAGRQLLSALGDDEALSAPGRAFRGSTLSARLRAQADRLARAPVITEAVRGTVPERPPDDRS